MQLASVVLDQLQTYPSGPKFFCEDCRLDIKSSLGAPNLPKHGCILATGLRFHPNVFRRLPQSDKFSAQVATSNPEAKSLEVRVPARAKTSSTVTVRSQSQASMLMQRT